jgi:hypothetical protein
MAMRPHVRRDKRQAALLHAIQAAPQGRWKSGRAAGALRKAGWPVSASTASADLQALVAAGHLARHEEAGVVWYEPLGGGQ